MHFSPFLRLSEVKKVDKMTSVVGVAVCYECAVRWFKGGNGLEVGLIVSVSFQNVF